MCRDCGYESPKWVGKCSSCGAWNTMEEFTPQKETKQGFTKIQDTSTDIPILISDIPSDDTERTKTNIGEFDRVLGGGLVSGSLILLAGDPGIGKSTILLQVCASLSANNKVLYVSGEESKHQLKMRASRLVKTSSDAVYVMGEVNMSSILSAVSKLEPDILIIDSVQTMYNSDLDSAPGSVSQIRDVTMLLMRLAKSMNITVFLVGHVTKEGTIAGPKILEHMVDTVLYFEGDNSQSYRILRAAKNRFGSTNEIGVFEMNTMGLCEVQNPSAAMLSERGDHDLSGSSVICLMEGTRPLLSEVQALCTKSFLGMPRRTAAGVDFNRLSMLLAVLEKKINLNLSGQDVYVNMIGGIKTSEPSADLGICMAIASSFLNFTLPRDILFVGEVGLGGEIRSVAHIGRRIAEAEKMGFSSCVIPGFNHKNITEDFSIEIFPVKTLSETIKLFK